MDRYSMNYKIKNITIENFKTYKYLSFDVNSIFSIVVGENNIGKTTIFEALLLWETIYKKLISSNDKAFNKANSNYYLNFNDLFVLRNTV
jgi:AAA15 family ATPase/GTPase